MRAMEGKTTRAIVWCQFWTFPSVWGTFALGPEHRLDHPHVGWTMVDEFLGPVPDCGMMSHWGQNFLLCDETVRSLRRDGCCPLAQIFPEGGERKICEASHSMFSTGRTLWCRCGFFRPHL